ncbi:MAG: Signal recognition particle receptor FtsY [candidate division TM6 bacterium GW2011_GWF2_32_72]|nr:MAG: Signal recognition particle receptor FtsY [candidate division TM6 bacterium GW2011_GWF2_32_72]
MFNFIKNKLQKVYNSFTSKMHSLFSRQQIDSSVLKELEEILISADVGVKPTQEIIKNLSERFANGEISEGEDLKKALEDQLLNMLQKDSNFKDTQIFLLVGINGSGKTTFAAKLANMLKNEGKKVLLVAGDTFRAAATEQLVSWGSKIGVEVVVGKDNQDPASVVFSGCKKFVDEAFDAVIIDTAGRLQTKTNLMKELEKIGNVVTKVAPGKKVASLLTIDSMLGQNSLEQAKIFNESTKLDGIILTKMDGTAKGGIVFAIEKEIKVPVAYISFGEKIDDFDVFDSKKFVQDLLSE